MYRKHLLPAKILKSGYWYHKLRTRPCLTERLTERLLMGCKESNQTNEHKLRKEIS